MKISEETIRFVWSKLSELNRIHTNAMRPIGLELAMQEKANTEIVEWAMLFHDIAKDLVKFHEHAKEGALICRDYLLDREAHWRTIEAICHCIETHGWAWIAGDPKP